MEGLATSASQKEEGKDPSALFTEGINEPRSYGSSAVPAAAQPPLLHRDKFRGERALNRACATPAEREGWEQRHWGLL